MIEKARIGLEPKKNEEVAVKKEIPDNFSFGMPNQKLDVGKIEGYYTRWINDIPGRVQLALSDGYSFVTMDEVDVYTDVTSMNAGEGNQIRKLVGVQADGATPLFAYYMKLPLEWKSKKESILQSKMDAIEESINSGRYNLGNQAQSAYIPGEGIKIGRKG